MKRKFIFTMSLLTALFMSTSGICAEDSNKDRAFEKSLKEQLPMSKEQIREFKERMDSTQKEVRKKEPPKMSSRTRQLSFQTGDEPPVVRIAPSYVTTISFFDSTGKPWPISNVVVGNSEYYEVQRPEGKESTITVTAKKKHVSSNLAITFEGQDMPATVQLKSVEGGKDTDSMVVFRAEGRGPNAEEPAIGPRAEDTIDSTIMAFLDMVPPESAERVELEPEMRGVDLWLYKGRFYLRTESPLLWPAWESVTKGPQGVRVYELSQVSSLMVSKGGESMSLETKNRGELDEQ